MASGTNATGMGNTAGMGLFQLAEQRLAWIDRREPLLAANIANADTPGYKPRDLASFADILAGQEASLAQTNPRHMAGTRDPKTGRPSAVREVSPDGNAVSLETELVRMADTQTAQQTTTQLYTSYMGMFRTALGKGS